MRSFSHRIILCVAGTVFAGTSFLASAQTSFTSENNKTVTQLGAYTTSLYVRFLEPLKLNCLYGVVYIGNDQKTIYALLLASKLSGKRIVTLDYTQPSGNGTACTIYGVVMED